MERSHTHPAALERVQIESWRFLTIKLAEQQNRAALIRQVQDMFDLSTQSVQRRVLAIKADVRAGRSVGLAVARLPPDIKIPIRDALRQSEVDLQHVKDGIHFHYNIRLDQLPPPYDENRHPEAKLYGTQGMYEFLGLA